MPNQGGHNINNQIHSVHDLPVIPGRRPICYLDMRALPEGHDIESEIRTIYKTIEKLLLKTAPRYRINRLMRGFFLHENGLPELGPEDVFVSVNWEADLRFSYTVTGNLYHSGSRERSYGQVSGQESGAKTRVLSEIANTVRFGVVGATILAKGTRETSVYSVAGKIAERVVTLVTNIGEIRRLRLSRTALVIGLLSLIPFIGFFFSIIGLFACILSTVFYRTQLSKLRSTYWIGIALMAFSLLVHFLFVASLK